MVSLPIGSKINRLIVDSSDSATDLCKLGVEHPTDKSPYNTQRHRHPYTAVYDFLFARMRYQPINFGEIGIEKNQSMICWRAYFSKATLYGWDFDTKKLVHGEAAGLANTHYGLMNVKDPGNISSSLSAIGKQLDVLIDDSTHEFDDQIRIVTASLPFMKPGGILVVEDIFQGQVGYDEDTYNEALTAVKKYFSSILFVECRHKNRYSPGSNNDKLLVMFRNNAEVQI
jgi:hypothetical protein